MSWPWRSPEATRRGLTDRIRARFDAEQVPRRMREVAYRRLLARLFSARPEGWMVKGGAALLLRLDPNRTSNDIDIAYLDEAAEHAVALAALRADAALDLGDFFSFEVGAGHIDLTDQPAERAWTAPVTARIGEKEWTTFGIDLVLPPTTILPEVLPSITPLVGDGAVDAIPGLTVLAIAPQLADKTCAIFERHGNDAAPSSRPRDLADIAMIALQVDEIDGDDLLAAVRSEELRRQHAGSLHQPLPLRLELDPAQERDWRARWTRATRAAPITFEEALHVADRFLGPVLANEVGEKRWRALEQHWQLPEGLP